MICACYVLTYNNFYIKIFLLQILFAGHMKFSHSEDQANRICTTLSCMYFQKHWQYGILPFLVVELILDRSTMEEHELCSSDKRN